jgi:hypothetical protein
MFHRVPMMQPPLILLKSSMCIVRGCFNVSDMATWVRPGNPKANGRKPTSSFFNFKLGRFVMSVILMHEQARHHLELKTRSRLCLVKPPSIPFNTNLTNHAIYPVSDKYIDYRDSIKSSIRLNISKIGPFFIFCEILTLTNVPLFLS